MPNIVIEEIVNNITLNIEEVISTYTIEVSEMQVPGADGKSAYQSAIDGGFIGTELEFNEILANQSGVNTGDETASTIINKIGDGSKINQSYLPSYVDDILEFDTVALFPLVGELGKIYIVTSGVDINKQYRWTGSTYNQITNGFIASTNDVPEGTNNWYFTVSRFLSNLTATNIKNALGITTLSGSNTGDQDLSGKQNLLTNPLTGAGSELDPITYALQDGTILYHSVKWFVPTSTVSTSGTTVASVGTQFTLAMVGSKLIINGEWRIITAFTSSTVVTVASAYSQNYIGVVAGSWGVYNKSLQIVAGEILFYGTTGSNRGKINSSSTISSDIDAIGNEFQLRSLQGFKLRNTLPILWTSGNNADVTPDIALRRNSAGVLEIYDGITATGLEANRRDLLVRDLISSGIVRLKNYTVATLPAGTQGDTAFVTDALTPTYLGLLVGGGTIKCPVFYNGTAWVSH